MRLTVEFLGLSRKLAQTKETDLVLAADASYRDVLGYLADHFPALVGPVIAPETGELTEAFMLNIDGRRAMTTLDEVAQDGQRLALMFVEAGG